MAHVVDWLGLCGLSSGRTRHLRLRAAIWSAWVMASMEFRNLEMALTRGDLVMASRVLVDLDDRKKAMTSQQRFHLQKLETAYLNLVNVSINPCVMQ